jgi:hypothetical protein
MRKLVEWSFFEVFENSQQGGLNYISLFAGTLIENS